MLPAQFVSRFCPAQASMRMTSGDANRAVKSLRKVLLFTAEAPTYLVRNVEYSLHYGAEMGTVDDLTRIHDHKIRSDSETFLRLIRKDGPWG
jgi:hypothetical protein